MEVPNFSKLEYLCVVDSYKLFSTVTVIEKKDKIGLRVDNIWGKGYEALYKG